jgi:putative transposase
MPSKNRIKSYVENGYYHLYNRGVEKRAIFLDQQDYVVFLHLLKLYLLPLGKGISSINPSIPRIKRTFDEDIELHTFCLMPNHFHLLVHQNNEKTISNFMRALSTSYVMYFNKKYHRIGSLFQGAYKAVIVDNDSYLLHLSRYIHLNPLKSFAGSDPAKLIDYPYSSYTYYLGKKHARWVKTDFILKMFESEKNGTQTSIKQYKDFVESYAKELRGNLPNELLLENIEN